MSVSVPSTASFLENDGTVQVCVTLTGTSVVPIGLTVSHTDGKVTQYTGQIVHYNKAGPN